jgi:hypothetical protein
MIVIWAHSSNAICQENQPSFKEYLESAGATTQEIDVFLNQDTWAQFDPDVGYILGNYMPKDGMDNSRTISTVNKDGTRTSFVYSDERCRINTYGNSFTHCHQVNDAETWQEYLAGHLGEPVRNYGMGGFGVYQAYRRMLRAEATENSADYIVLYIWGDDHIRTLLRCRYALIRDWNAEQDTKEGKGYMFHGNFWANIEMNLKTGELEEHESRIREAEKLYQMADPDWMYENLKDDLALQMYLYKQGKISDIDDSKLSRLSHLLGCEYKVDAKDKHQEVGNLLNKYAYSATKYILGKTREYASNNGKKLMVILFDPYGVTRQLLNGESREEQEIVDYLESEKFNYFDMNLVHVEDYKSFNLTISEYYKRYFIGHYSPSGNHFFAYSIKDRIVEWLDPTPLPYKRDEQGSIDFKNYLEGIKSLGGI